MGKQCVVTAESGHENLLTNKHAVCLLLAITCMWVFNARFTSKIGVAVT